MDYQKKLKEWYEHYEARYKKAVSLHIDEGSRHYQAFKEIEKRYSALYITLHFYTRDSKNSCWRRSGKAN